MSWYIKRLNYHFRLLPKNLVSKERNLGACNYIRCERFSEQKNMEIKHTYIHVRNATHAQSIKLHTHQHARTHTYIHTDDGTCPTPPLHIQYYACVAVLYNTRRLRQLHFTGRKQWYICSLVNSTAVQKRKATSRCGTNSETASAEHQVITHRVTVQPTPQTRWKVCVIFSLWKRSYCRIPALRR